MIVFCYDVGSRGIPHTLKIYTAYYRLKIGTACSTIEGQDWTLDNDRFRENFILL